MGRFGVDMSSVQADRGGGAVLPDEGVQEFEITGIKNGVQSKGKNAGAPYFSAKCVQISGDAPGVKATSQFLGLGTVPFTNGSSQQAQTKGFVEAIGLGQQLADMGADFDTDLMRGVTFRANVVHTTDNKNRPQADLYDIEPLSHGTDAAAGPTGPSNSPKAAASANPQTQAAAPAPVQTQPAATAQPSPPQAAPAAAPAAGRRRR